MPSELSICKGPANSSASDMSKVFGTTIPEDLHYVRNKSLIIRSDDAMSEAWRAKFLIELIGEEGDCVELIGEEGDCVHNSSSK